MTESTVHLVLEPRDSFASLQARVTAGGKSCELFGRTPLTRTRVLGLEERVARLRRAPAVPDPALQRELARLAFGDQLDRLVDFIAGILRCGGTVRVLLEIVGLARAHSLPWETAALGRELPGSRHRQLFRSRRVRLERVSTHGASPGETAAGRSRVLVVEGSHRAAARGNGGTNPLCPETPRRIERAVRRSGFRVERFRPVSGRRLAAKLREGWDIIHFVGHSGEQGRVLLFENVNGRRWSYTTRGFARQIGNALRPARLVLLTSCSIHCDSARQLARCGGVSRAVVLGADVGPAFVLQFAERLYEQLTGLGVAAAVQDARAHAALATHDLLFWVPVLWTTRCSVPAAEPVADPRS